MMQSVAYKTTDDGDACVAEDQMKAAFRHLIEQHLNALYGLARRLTRHQADAEDLVSEAITKAWAAFASLDDQARFKPWILRILHHCFISQYRRQRTRIELVTVADEGDIFALLDTMPDAFLAAWGDPERDYSNKLLARDIGQAIDALPSVYQSVIVLVHVDGLSYAEAAEVLSLPLGTVRSRIKRGRTLLQKHLWQQAEAAALTSVSKGVN